ncbi:MAG: BamA/OMP85 family outer membrane protein [Planctomycetota bacterium]|jgi:outer membrane protein assembly complex protein YaeT
MISRSPFLRRAPLVLALLLLAACASEEAARPLPAGLGVEFEGAEAMSRDSLIAIVRSDLERYAGTLRTTSLDDAAYRLMKEYETRGYYFVIVEHRVDGDTVVFVIDEGPQVWQGRMHFRGNEAISDETLGNAMPDLPGYQTPFSRRLLAVQTQAILAAYRRRGYIDVSLDEPGFHYVDDDQRMHVTFFLREGRQYRVSGFEGVPDVSELKDALSELIDKPYTPKTPPEVEAMVTDHFRQNGHPFASAKVEPRIDAEKAEVALVLEAGPGAAARFGDIRIKGNERTREGFILSCAGIPKGERYDVTEVLDAGKDLRRTGLFRTVIVSPGTLQEDEQEVPVEIEIEEVDYGELAARGGYGTLEGVRVGADAGYRNVFGGGEYVRAGGIYSRFGFRGSAGTGIPFLIGTDLEAGMTAYYEEREFPSFDATSYGGFPSLSYPLMDRLRVVGGVRFAFVETDDVEEGVPPGDLLDFDYRAFSLSASWDLRDNPMLPTWGAYLGGQIEWSGGPLDSDVTFVRTSGRTSLYVPLGRDRVFAISLQGGLIRPTESTDEMPISLRFFAGGTNTVRGFEYATLGPKVGGDPTGGEVFFALQMEGRFPIWNKFYGAVFSDRGGVWFDHNDVDLDDTRWSVGLGLRYYTPAGAIAADVGWNPSKEKDEDAVEFHFSIGFPF